MHFEILIEDVSGKELVDTIIPKLISEEDTYRTVSYKGVGRIPKNLKSKSEARARMLLDQLPRLLSGYGKSLMDMPSDYGFLVMVVCDLDDKELSRFREELMQLLDRCNTKPKTEFCIAIEEAEAWLLGDRDALLAVYPNAKKSILDKYKQDSICGTWEVLADAVYKGGVKKLKSQGWQKVGAEKSIWAKEIGKNMVIERNISPSFIYFKNIIKNHSKISES